MHLCIVIEKEKETKEILKFDLDFMKDREKGQE